MFRSIPTAEPAPVEFDSPPSEPVPLSVLALDLDATAIGWAAYLQGRGIQVTLDDIGRLSIARADAQQLFDEHRESEAQKARRRRLVEAKAVADDQLRRAQIWQGVPADRMPAGVAPAAELLSAARDSQPRRQTPLEEALSNRGDELTFHSLAPAADEL
jgi:hypothetical protein